MQVLTRRGPRTEGDSPLDSSPLKLHRRFSGRKGYSTRTMRRSASANIRRLPLAVDIYRSSSCIPVFGTLLHRSCSSVCSLARVNWACSALRAQVVSLWIAHARGWHGGSHFKSCSRLWVGGVSVCDILRCFR